MSNSFSFNAIDMADYGLVVNNVDLPLTQEAQYIQLRNRGYAFDSFRTPLIMGVSVSVLSTSHSTLLTYLDSIRRTLNYRVDKKVIFDTQTNRYWMARFDSMEGMFGAPTMWSGNIMFICHDPAAYGNTILEPFSHDHAIDAVEDTIIETPGGTDYIYPVWTLTSKEDHGTVTIKLDNLTTDEELLWRGIFQTDSELEIDAANWLVKLDTNEHMANVSGKFPRLAPNIANSIKVTRLYESGPAGILNIAYRNRFL